MQFSNEVPFLVDDDDVNVSEGMLILVRGETAGN